jgi:hypothetical protein
MFIFIMKIRKSKVRNAKFGNNASFSAPLPSVQKAPLRELFLKINTAYYPALAERAATAAPKRDACSTGDMA